VDGALRYFLDENQGWFDAVGKRAIDHRTILSDGFPAWEGEEKAMKAQWRYIAAGGFVHAPFRATRSRPTAATIVRSILRKSD
jgi:hypothetical protein